jgi:hypothetical protein
MMILYNHCLNTESVKTSTELKVKSRLNLNEYQKGISVLNEEIKQVVLYQLPPKLYSHKLYHPY